MRLRFSLALLLAGAMPALAQPAARGDTLLRDDRNFSFYDRGPYRASVPRPESILGYAVGEQNTQFALQERTLLAIADAAKDRVRVEEIGSTAERRTMRLYIISAPENIQRLDAIRADIGRIADPRGAAAAELDAVAARTPVVVMINESVHGNESPGFEAAMQTLYHFAASEEPATVATLRNTIIVLNPSTNPDGHERFTVWYNSINVANPDPGSNEHREPWSIQGRYNHYRFDMNRDVMTTTQREVRALVRAIDRWHPMVAVDQHGQTTNYFFPPAARPVNENLGDPKWLDIIGKGNAAAFDRYGWMYFVRDQFDLYGPFYWDTWPGLTGATGMTYETDGGGWKGLLWRRDDGSLLSFRDGIAKHFVAARATIETVGQRSAERVRDYLRFRQNAVAEGRTGRMKRVILVPGSDPARTAELVSTLLRGGIEVRRVDAPFTSARAHAYYDDAIGSRRFDAGAYVIDLAQPLGKAAKAILEPSPTLDTVFANTQIEKYQRNLRRARGANREGFEFYDVTAWSLPVTFGVEAYWSEDAPAVTGDLLTVPAESPVAAPSAAAPPSPRAFAVEPLPVEIPSGIVGGARAGSAYIFAGGRDGSSRLAYHLLDAGFRVSATAEEVDAGGRKWPRGTFIVRVARNDTTLHARLDALARESRVEVHPVNSAFSDEGQFGIGSSAVVSLETPRIALVGDEGVSQTAYGSIWWSFERRFGIRFTPVSIGYLAGSDLSKFNVVIIPDASSGALSSRLGKSGADRLRGWVENGGTLITMGGATAWAANENVNLTSARPVRHDTSDAGKRDTTAARSGGSSDSTEVARRRERASDRTAGALIPAESPMRSENDPAPLAGSFFDVALDRTHWLTFGYQTPRLTVMLDGDHFLKLSKEGSNVAVFPATGKLHRAGFVFPGNTERLLRNTALLIEEPLGAGHVVLFNNEPMFRAWWRALDRMVLNAVLLGPAY